MSFSLSDRRRVISAIVCFILPLFILLIPTGATFTPAIRLFLVITLMGVLCWAVDIVPQGVPAILMPIAYLLFGIAPAPVIFGVWSEPIPWMMLGGLILANVLLSTGLLERVAYRSITFTGGSYTGLLMGLVIAGIIGNILAPGKVAIPMAALTFGICKALDLGKSRASAGIMLGGAMGALLPQQFIYNPVNLSLTVENGQSVTGPINVSWLDYLWYNLPSVLYVFLVVYLVGRYAKPKDLVLDKAFFEEKYRDLGQWSLAEKKALIICLGLFTVLVVGSFLGWPIMWAFAIFPCLFFLPGIDIGKREDISRLDFTFVLFITACLGIGATAGELGIGKLFAENVTPHLEGHSIFITFALIWLCIVLANFLLTPLAIISVLSVPLAELALALSINPLCVYFFTCNAYDVVFLPYEYALYLIFFSFALIPLKDFVKIMSIKAVVSLVFLMAIQLPFWMVTGLITG
ncbi:SLC13 family permease [Peptococcus simiae]|uniref:SLC13 family permease n=1 Tax=Peptococcus simiae TaxID=1643805 RepID=A0ABW9GZJ2_9FIRM